MSRREMRTVAIYALSEPMTDVVRYVGATEWLKMRYHEHVNGSTRTTRTWVHRLLKRGLIPCLRVLDMVKAEAARETESLWISYYRKRGNLLNVDLREYHGEMAEGANRLIAYTLHAKHSIKSIAKAVGWSGTFLSAAARGRASISLETALQVRSLTKSKKYPKGLAANFKNWPLLRSGKSGRCSIPGG